MFTVWHGRKRITWMLAENFIILFSLYWNFEIQNVAYFAVVRQFLLQGLEINHYLWKHFQINRSYCFCWFLVELDRRFPLSSFTWQYVRAFRSSIADWAQERFSFTEVWGEQNCIVLEIRTKIFLMLKFMFYLM